jgi:hypothetical protein
MSQAKNIFEKLFGNKPEDGGFMFNSLDYTLGWCGVVLSWSCQGIGFGQIAFRFDPEKGLDIDDECMSKEFVLKAITEAEDRIKKGQKASVTLFCKKEGIKYEESKENNELFIKNVLLTFKKYILQDYFNQWKQS